MDQRKAVILCVDDEENPLVLRKFVLQKAGYEVLTASSGKEALELTASRSVDLVLSDHLMPGMNGTELAQQIKAEHPNLPVILISGVNELPAGSAHANAFVSKIEGPDALCKEVAAVLNLPFENCENC
jgi:CheY-like chemotaxis protein